MKDLIVTAVSLGLMTQGVVGVVLAAVVIVAYIIWVNTGQRYIDQHKFK